jgi:two-component system response regulator TctD
VAILDVGLPRMDGFEVLARLRGRGKNLPVLMLTARSDVKDRVHGLNLGADDYLAKPFELTELEARVKALLRRSVLGGERQQRCGVLVYDLDTRRFTLGEELLTLTSREQACSKRLIARPGRVMSKEQLASQVFGLDEEASPDAIEIYIHRLRKKLDGQPVAIVTFRGLGYLLEPAMHKPSSLRWRLLWNLALLLVVLMLASGLSAYWNGREAADTAYDRTLLASARTIAAGLSQRDGTLSADVPYVALDTFAYDSAGRIYYQVNDIQQKLISGYENLPPPPPGTPRTDDYPALARFYNATYLGQDVRVVSLLKAVSEPNMNGMAEIRVAETDEARVSMARSWRPIPCCAWACWPSARW